MANYSHTHAAHSYVKTGDVYFFKHRVTVRARFLEHKYTLSRLSMKGCYCTILHVNNDSDIFTAIMGEYVVFVDISELSFLISTGYMTKVC